MLCNVLLFRFSPWSCFFTFLLHFFNWKLCLLSLGASLCCQKRNILKQTLSVCPISVFLSEKDIYYKSSLYCESSLAPARYQWQEVSKTGKERTRVIFITRALQSSLRAWCIGCTHWQKLKFNDCSKNRQHQSNISQGFSLSWCDKFIAMRHLKRQHEQCA